MTPMQSVDFYIKKDCDNVAEVYAKIHFLNKHPASKYPQYYEDNTKGKMLGLFDHPELVAYAKEVIARRKKTLAKK